MPDNTLIQSPLAINIFWNNASKEMYTLADTLYSFYAGNIENPLDSYLNIPVHLYPYIPDVADLHLESSQHTANIFLIDNKMVVSKDWKMFGEQLLQKTTAINPKQHRFFPVAISENAYKWSRKIKNINFVRWYEQSKNSRNRYLLTTLSHQITRLLYESSDLIVSNRYSKLPIKLFLSHAKSDGLEIVKKLQNYIHEKSGLKTFFDARDIPSGVDFSEEIVGQVKESLLVVIHSDNYSSRQWCRKEVLCAKEHDCPIIVVNQFKQGEYRSFPYIGNVPHIRYTEDDSEENLLGAIVLEAIREALKFRHNALKIAGLAKAFDKEIPTVLAYPPELITLIKLEEIKDSVILYPDPPIGEEELSLLKTFRSDLKFVTPTLLPLLSENGGQFKKLEKLKIAISLSEIQHAETAWIQNRAIQNLMVEITRYLLVSGAQLIYSGHLNYKSKNANEEENNHEIEKKEQGFNFVQLLIEIIKTHQQSYKIDNVKAIDNYSFFPVSANITEKVEADLMDWVNFIKVNPPENLEVNEKDAEKILQYDTFDKKCVWADSLTEMRKKMLDAANAFIILGGKSLNFKSKMPGVLEEAFLALKAQKPVFLIGAFGGISTAIMQALQGEQPEKLTLSYYEEKYHAYAYFLEKYNEEWAIGDQKVDYPSILKFFNVLKEQEDYGLNNGLSRAENERLFHSKNELEILTLIFKGLKNITSNERPA